MISKEVKDDLWIWKKVIATYHEGMPLGDIYGEPPFRVVRYILDATGATYERAEDKSRNILEDGTEVWPQ